MATVRNFSQHYAEPRKGENIGTIHMSGDCIFERDNKLYSLTLRMSYDIVEKEGSNNIKDVKRWPPNGYWFQKIKNMKRMEDLLVKLK